MTAAGRPAEELSPRFIILEYGEGGWALDSGIYMPDAEPMTADVAVERTFFWALGEIDDRYYFVERDAPDSACEVYVPPPNLPLVGQPDQDGESRQDVIAEVLERCRYVATLGRHTRTHGEEA